MKKKLGMALAVVATAVIGIVSLVGCTKITKTMGAQIDALTEVKSGQSELAIIDSTMAGYLLKSDTSFSDLKIIELEDFTPEAEEYGVAAKKGNTKLINFINSKLVELKSTAYADVADKYGLNDRKMDLTWNGTSADYDGWKTNLKDSSKVVIGYTLNAPMGIEDANKNVTGFDIDLAKKVFEGTGVTVETKLINWDSKELELNDQKIDLVWNGMTITDERMQNMQVSIPYLTNVQAIVVSSKNADKYKKVADLKGVKIAVEQGSAGEEVALELEKLIKKAK